MRNGTAAISFSGERQCKISKEDTASYFLIISRRTHLIQLTFNDAL